MSGEERRGELEWAGESERPHSELRRCFKGAWEEKKLLARSEEVLKSC